MILANSAHTRSAVFLVAFTSLFAGPAIAAPRAPGAFVSTLPPCATTRSASFSSALLSPGNLAAYRPGQPEACSENLLHLSPDQESASEPRKRQTNSPSSIPQSQSSASDHRFWGRENDLLFTAVAASRTVDYFSTLNFRRRGRNEILLTNDVVDNHAAFASIEAAGTAVSIGVSYLFHHYNHHRLERWTSIIHASLATGGAVRNYCLKTAHP